MKLLDGFLNVFKVVGNVPVYCGLTIGVDDSDGIVSELINKSSYELSDEERYFNNSANVFVETFAEYDCTYVTSFYIRMTPYEYPIEDGEFREFRDKFRVLVGETSPFKESVEWNPYYEDGDEDEENPSLMVTNYTFEITCKEYVYKFEYEYDLCYERGTMTMNVSWQLGKGTSNERDEEVAIETYKRYAEIALARLS